MTILQPRASPAARRLKRVHWSMTAVFATTSALCLLLLAAIAVRVDLADREAKIATEVSQQAVLRAADVDYDEHGLDLNQLDASQPPPEEEVVGVITDNKIVFASPSQRFLPTNSSLGDIVKALTPTTPVARFVLPTDSGQTYRWAAVPVLNLGKVGAVVIVGGPTPGLHEHRFFAEMLIVTVAALTLLAAAAGHLISGIAMRPARKSLERQEQFLAEASHELRTPLARLGLILDVETRDPDRTDRDTISRAAAEVKSLAGLVTGLMARARDEEGRPQAEFRRLRLDQLIESQVRQYPSKTVTVHLPHEAPVVFANPDLLAQALWNLLDNANRYAGELPIDVIVGERSFTIRDHGAGIEPRLHRSIRRPGVGSAEGTGRGLAIVEWIAQLHHGVLSFAETPHGGLTVTFTIGRPTEGKR